MFPSTGNIDSIIHYQSSKSFHFPSSEALLSSALEISLLIFCQRLFLEGFSWSSSNFGFGFILGSEFIVNVRLLLQQKVEGVWLKVIGDLAGPRPLNETHQVVETMRGQTGILRDQAHPRALHLTIAPPWDIRRLLGHLYPALACLLVTVHHGTSQEKSN